MKKQNGFKMLFCLSSGSGKLKDKKHQTNFINYLFSKTRNHSENEMTKNNVFSYSNVIDFNKDPSRAKQNFNRWFNKNEYDFNNVKFDLNYILYFFYNDKKIYTNFFHCDDGELYLTFDDDIFNAIYQQYNVSKLDIEKVLDLYLEDSELFLVDDTPEELKLKIHSMLNRGIERKTNVKSILSISHCDQGLFHIHRLIDK